MLTRLGVVFAMVLATIVLTAGQASACETAANNDLHGIDYGAKCPAGTGADSGDGRGEALPSGTGDAVSPTSRYDKCMAKQHSKFVCSAYLPTMIETGEPAPNQPDAAQLAQKAGGRINFAAPKIGLSPVPPNPAIVNLQTWLWLEGGNWTPRTGSAKAGDTTVTATAEPVSVTWGMGEGTTVCSGPGRKWVPGLGQGATSSCGFTYRHTSNDQPGDEYEISATVHYNASWTCEGDCSDDGGDLGLVDAPTATADLKVTERQTVVTFP